jgi:hypothetical protein
MGIEDMEDEALRPVDDEQRQQLQQVLAELEPKLQR